ncbi:hypothetical protein ACOSP7_004535 [Xanthoceras sorbifolium]
MVRCMYEGDFHMSVKAINEFYGLDIDSDHIDWEAYNPKCNAYSEALVQEVGTFGQPTQTSAGTVMFKEQLNLDSAFWNKFSFYSVFPTVVDAYRRDEIVIPPPPNLDRHIYNDLARGRHDPEFASRHRAQPRIDEEDVMA